MKQEGILANWALGTLTPKDLEDATDNLIKKATEQYDKVGQLKPEELNIENCVQALLNVECVLMNEEGPIDFPQHAVSSKELRDASVANAKKLNAFNVELAMRKDIFDNLTAFSANTDLMNKLSYEQKRFVDKEIISGKRNGLHLDEKTREEVKSIKKEISDLGTTFGSNLNEDTTYLLFSEEELKGVPEDLIKSFEKEDNKCKVTLKYPHFFPVTRKCRNADTRKKIETAYQSRCMKENTEILEKLVELRQRQADLLGYKTHASYIQELRMAKNPENVKAFYESLVPKLQPIWEKEKAEILKLKEEECAEDGREFNGQLDFWDMRYYTNKIEETRYAVDKAKLKEYFPLEKVTKGLLEIYQQLLGLKFTKLDPKDIDAWHEEVELFKVQDSESKDIMGYFYLDLHPRDGKFGHAAVFPLQPGCIGPDGTMQVSLCAMMANFSKSTESKPALLDHDEVETYFHEFGHVMHNVCSQTESPRFAFLRVERDFVEAPSQMLENWVWEEEPLRKMSGHYKDDSPIPKELLDKLIASRIANAGAFNLRQIILGTFDQRIHTTGRADTQDIFSNTYKEVIGINTIPNTNMPANFGHMVGYDAQYYGYLWSEVFCFDMYETRFKKEGLLNPSVGIDYRNKILKPGGSKDALDLLTDFLGREPNDAAFLRSKGLE